jgi:hypothetical protein
MIRQNNNGIDLEGSLDHYLFKRFSENLNILICLKNMPAMMRNHRKKITATILIKPPIIAHGYKFIDYIEFLVDYALWWITLR